MGRISGGQLSREAKATLLSSHAGGPRTAAGDKTFVGQTKAADTVVKSQPAASPKDLPVGSDVTAQTTSTLTVRVVRSATAGHPLLGVNARASVHPPPARTSAVTADGRALRRMLRGSGGLRLLMAYGGAIACADVHAARA
jgi:hypothetical protein